MPQCGFSRATIQVLSMHGVDPEKFAAYNVLEDPELRQGMVFFHLANGLGESNMRKGKC
jgi:Glutaredoxin-related protein